jgi:transposase-like protein
MEGMSEVLQKLFNLAMKLERENVLKASPYQRTEGRTGYANGFKERHIQSRVGELALQIPQTRNVEFYPSGYVIKLKTLLNALYFWRFFHRFFAIFSIKTLSVVLHFLPI